MKPRFSIRRLLLLTASLALVLGLFIRPTLRAKQLVSDVNNGEFHELDSMGVTKALWLFKDLSGQKYALDELRIEATLHPRTWRDLLSFRRRVSIDVWPPTHATHLGGMSGYYVYVRFGAPKLGGELWE